MRILIVDDSQDIRVLLKHILNKLGYEVVAAANGVEAWEILQKEEINFVITDWVMPEMDGLELTTRIREANLPYYTYVIMLTVKGEKDEMIKGMESGADDFIVKPFEINELSVRIRAGERVINLEKNLEKQNRKLKEVNIKLKQAYAQMRDWKDQLSTQLSGEQIGFLLTLDGQILGASQKAQESTGRRRNELVGSNFLELIDEDSGKELKRALREAQIGLSPQNYLNMITGNSQYMGFEAKVMQVDTEKEMMLLVLMRKLDQKLEPGV